MHIVTTYNCEAIKDKYLRDMFVSMESGYGMLTLKYTLVWYIDGTHFQCVISLLLKNSKIDLKNNN